MNSWFPCLQTDWASGSVHTAFWVSSADTSNAWACKRSTVHFRDADHAYSPESLS